MAELTMVSSLAGFNKGVQIHSLIWLLLCGVSCFGQDPELGRVERRGDRATLVVDGPRPVDSAAKTLAWEFGIRVNVEDPGPGFPLSRGRSAVEFQLEPGGRPDDTPGLLRRIVEEANATLLVRYRLDAADDWYSIIPMQTRDGSGKLVPVTPLLDRLITIPMGTRPVRESADLMAKELSLQTGARVHCCQAFVAGIPWGLPEVAFSASEEPARLVLKRLIVAAAGGRASGEHWLLRCDASSPAWCFINLAHVR